ncbi:hypothetical protein [Myxococcus virescens]|uniref:Uncharacterized protein n=1 Tax=Myxococcus virescens TaxID=83456 RepID=A0A511HP98_9BACT|nr:hypothetical protein [Myxococcus virescens]GEL75204.1 hypothetical protein MVI01_69880 [Myxococcus virescens]SDD65186.1 hypothetical protein SAMN04488504_102129 [Myxococcus virescens]
MRAVRFSHSHEHGRTGYLSGEVAGFPDDVAARLVSTGVAKYLTPDSAAPSEGTPPSPADGPPSASEGAAPLDSALTAEEQLAPLMPPEPPPDPAAERAAIEADNVSRTTPKSERRKR